MLAASGSGPVETAGAFDRSGKTLKGRQLGKKGQMRVLEGNGGGADFPKMARGRSELVHVDGSLVRADLTSPHLLHSSKQRIPTSSPSAVHSGRLKRHMHSDVHKSPMRGDLACICALRFPQKLIIEAACTWPSKDKYVPTAIRDLFNSPLGMSMATRGTGDGPRPKFLLHTYYRSSCSARLRIALNLKAIHAEYAYVHLFKDEQMSPEHEKLNPSRSVPVLTHLVGDGPPFPITQSAAAIEYLEEVYPDRCPLLPSVSRLLERAKVRVLTNIVTNDIQPITNRRIAKAIRSLGGDVEAWNEDFMTRGLEAYERIAEKTAGLYSVGDAVSMADVCLIPAIWNAEKSNVDLENLPTVMRIYRALSELEAVQKAHWRVQADCPEDGSWL